MSMYVNQDWFYIEELPHYPFKRGIIGPFELLQVWSWNIPHLILNFCDWTSNYAGSPSRYDVPSLGFEDLSSKQNLIDGFLEENVELLTISFWLFLLSGPVWVFWLGEGWGFQFAIQLWKGEIYLFDNHILLEQRNKDAISVTTCIFNSLQLLCYVWWKVLQFKPT